jgi:hypothetical protein
MKRLFWSNHYTSMMMKFLSACFNNNVPDNMSIQQIAGRKLVVEVVHKPALNGKIYTEVVGYHGYNGNDETDELYYDGN